MYIQFSAMYILGEEQGQESTDESIFRNQKEISQTTTRISMERLLLTTQEKPND